MMAASGRIRKRKHKSHLTGDTAAATLTTATPGSTATPASLATTTAATPTPTSGAGRLEETMEEVSLAGDYNNFTHNFVDFQNLLNFNEFLSSSQNGTTGSGGSSFDNTSSASSAIKLTNGPIKDTLLGTVLTTATATVAPAASSLLAKLGASTTSATAAVAAVAAGGSRTAIADPTTSTYYANLLNMSPATTSLISAAAATKSYNDSVLRWEQLDGSVDFTFDPLYRHSLAMSIVYCVAYILVFLVGLVGNSFVIAVVLRAPRMRTVTNYFIVNLVGGPLNHTDEPH